MKHLYDLESGLHDTLDNTVVRFSAFWQLEKSAKELQN